MAIETPPSALHPSSGLDEGPKTTHPSVTTARDRFPLGPRALRLSARRSGGVWRLLDAAALGVASWPVLTAPDGYDITSALVFVVVALLWIEGLDHRTRYGRFSQVMGPIASAAALAAVVSALAARSLHGTTENGGYLAAFLVATGAIGCLRLLEASFSTASARHGHGMATVILGTGRAAELVADRLRSTPSLGLAPVGFIDDDPLGHPSLPVLGRTSELERILISGRIRNVVLAFPRASHVQGLDLVERCEAVGASVLVVPRLYEAFPRRVTINHLGALPLVALHPSSPDSAGLRVKYALDRLLAAALLIVASPVALAISAAILLTMGRPVLFSQERVGKHGRVFTIHKFRTMRVARPGERGGDADRVTSLGRVLRATSLDELPQLINIIRGEMSFVGPRPERPELAAEFAAVVPGYGRRHRVRPGITGWAQVHGIGRGQDRFSLKDLRDRAEWDNHYIENWSVPLETSIYARTVVALFRHRQTTV